MFSFYQFAPPIFAVLHLYVLMQLYLLARSLRVFDDQLRTARVVPTDRRIIRTQLDKFVFTQLLIAAPESDVVLTFLRIVVWLSFVVGPILLLLAFQLRFLPYHDVFVTYIHRFTLLVDVALLWLMWPRVSRGTRPAWSAGRWHPAWWSALGLFSAALGIFSFCVATVPQEGIEAGRLLAGFGPSQSYLVIPPSAQLIEPDRDKLAKLDRTITLQERDLRWANMRSINLRKADMTFADLTHASLYDAHLEGADLSVADLSYASLFNGHLGDANMNAAFLTETDLRGADLSLVRNLRQARLSEACGSSDTKLPPGLKVEKSCVRKAVPAKAAD